MSGGVVAADSGVWSLAAVGNSGVVNVAHEAVMQSAVWSGEAEREKVADVG